MTVMSSPTAEQINKFLQEDTENTYNVVADTTQAIPEVDENGKLSFTLPANSGNPVDANIPLPSAELQYLARIQVPGQFFHRCSPNLKTEILKEFHKNRNFMFRCRHYDAMFSGVDLMSPARTDIRAILGPKFPTDRDDIYTFPIVLEALNQPNTRLVRFEKTEQVTELVASFLDTRVEMDGVVTQGSLSITNSETGHSSLWIEPHIQIMDGIWIGNRFGDKVAARYVHRGELPTAEELREDIEQAKRIVQIGIVQYLEASQQRVSSTDAIKYMENMAVLPKRFSTIIAEEIKNEDRILKIELIRRILLATQELPLMQSLQIRREVGGYVGLFENTASRMATLANQLE